MTTANSAQAPDARALEVQKEWLNRLDALVQSVDQWAKEFDWSTRQIQKQLNEAPFGAYQVPVLLLQKDTVRVLLEPISSSAPGADGVVDLYLVPAYDDIASLYFCNGQWQIHYMYPGSPTVADIRSADSQPLSKEALKSVLEEMSKNAC